MKKLTFLWGITFLWLFGSCSSPIDYNTSIMNEVEKVEKEVLKITEQQENSNLEKTQKAFQEGKKQIKSSLEKLENMSAFREDDALRQAAIKLVKFYDEFFTNENQEALDISAITQKEREVKQNLIDAQCAFIKRYDLNAVAKGVWHKFDVVSKILLIFAPKF